MTTTCGWDFNPVIHISKLEKQQQPCFLVILCEFLTSSRLLCGMGAIEIAQSNIDPGKDVDEATLDASVSLQPLDNGAAGGAAVATEKHRRGSGVGSTQDSKASRMKYLMNVPWRVYTEADLETKISLSAAFAFVIFTLTSTAYLRFWVPAYIFLIAAALYGTSHNVLTVFNDETAPKMLLSRHWSCAFLVMAIALLHSASLDISLTLEFTIANLDVMICRYLIVTLALKTIIMSEVLLFQAGKFGTRPPITNFRRRRRCEYQSGRHCR